MTDYAYGPGEWTALAHGGRAALLEPSIEAAAVDRIWESLSAGGPLEAWLEVLAGNGLAALPSFGFVETGEDGVRVVVRGDVVALVDDYDISAGGMRTWREHVAPVGTGVALQVGDTGGESPYPLVGGVVLAATLQVGRPRSADAADAQGAAGAEAGTGSDEADTTGADATDADSTDGAADDVLDDAALDASVDAAPGEHVAEEAVPEPGTQQDDQQTGDEQTDDQQPDQQQDDQQTGDEQTDDQQDAAAVGDPADVDVAGDEVDGTDSYEAAPGEQAEGLDDWSQGAEGAQLEDLPDGQEAAGAEPVVPQEGGDGAETGSEAPEQADPAPAPDALPEEARDAVQDPWAAPQAPAGPWSAPVGAPATGAQAEPSPWGPPPAVTGQPEQQPAVPAGDDEAGDHDGYTIRAAELPEHEPVEATLAPVQDDGGAGQQAPPAPAVQLSLSTGQQVELDRPVLIGRAPESSRFGFGETPRLVTVPSPQQDISRTHVEIKLEGDHVLVTDLRSTNGTVVVMPGAPPRRLHPGESVPVAVGTVVDLGDGVTGVVAPPTASVPTGY